MTFRTNDFVGATVKEVLRTLEDLGAEVSFMAEEAGTTYIETDGCYGIEFEDNFCVWSGYGE